MLGQPVLLTQVEAVVLVAQQIQPDQQVDQALLYCVYQTFTRPHSQVD
jgi:hypothetical protein